MKKNVMPTKKKAVRTRGKVYDATLGASNHQRAREGRFYDHEAFSAMRGLTAVKLALPNLAALSDAPALARRMTAAWDTLRREAGKLKTQGDKLRFADAIAEFFNPATAPDNEVERVCWLAIEMRTRNGEKPSQAELRKAARGKVKAAASDELWKDLMRKTGLKKTLPTALQKRRGGQSA